jgi:hypothetical protein
MSQERSAEWLRGAREEVRRLEGECDVVFRGEPHITRMALCERAEELKTLLAEAEAREASVPTAADLAVADELDMLAAHIQQYIGPDDARDDIRRICRNRAEDLRRGVKRGPSAATGTGTLTLSETIAGLREACAGVVVSKHEEITAAEVIAAAERALRCGKWEHFTSDEREMMAAAFAAIAKWKEAHNA